MEGHWFCVLSSLACLFSLALLGKLIILRTNKPNHPPGPKPWPIIGNLNLIGAIPHQSLHALSKKYGDIMQLKFGSSPVIVVSTPEMAKEFLKTHGTTFASRPATAAGKHTSYNFSDMAWAPYGPFWRQARRICANELLSAKQLHSYEYIRIEEVKSLVRRLHANSGKLIVLREYLLHFTLTSMSRMALGEKYFTESKCEDGSTTNRSEELHGLIREWFYLGGVFNLGDWIPWLNFLDLQGYVKRMKAFQKKIDQFHNYVIKAHKERRELLGKNFEPKDLLDVLLRLVGDPSLEVKLTNDNVKGLIQDILAGGTDTAAIIVEWAMSELLKQPHLLEKANEELDRIIGRERWVEEREAVQDLPYVDAIVKETLRLHPPATLLAPHQSIEDCNVAGYYIPKGTILIVSVWNIGRDSRFWERPGEFRPERFIGKDINEMGQHFELLPFGSGRRMCPGNKLGMRMIRSTLANLLHGFTWKLPDHVLPVDVGMEEEYGLSTCRKIPIGVIVKPRLEPNMY